MIYLDTGCLLKLYFPEPESSLIVNIVYKQSIAFTPLHALELQNALELKRFRREATPKQFRNTSALIEEDLRTGVLYRPAIHSLEDVFSDTVDLSKRYTRSFGCRSLDILHCAAARRMRVATFITTDTRQRRLAMAIGLHCPSISPVS